MTDLIAILNTLLDKDGQILVPGIMDDVLPLSEEERKLYGNIDFDIRAFKDEIGAAELLHSVKVRYLKRMISFELGLQWRIEIRCGTVKLRRCAIEGTERFA